MTKAPIPRPEDRYGRQRPSGGPRRRVTIAVAVLGLAAGVIAAVVGYQRLGTAAVSGSLAGYQLIDGETASVTISVTRSDRLVRQTASCGSDPKTAAKRAGARSWCRRPNRKRCRSLPP